MIKIVTNVIKNLSANCLNSLLHLTLKNSIYKTGLGT